MSLNISQNIIDFGIVPIGKNLTYSITIHNGETESLIIDELKIPNNRNSFFFNYLTGYTDNYFYPIVVEPGSSIVLFLRFAPKEDDYFSSSLEVVHDGIVDKIKLFGKGKDNTFKEQPITILFNEPLDEIDFTLFESGVHKIEGKGFIDDINTRRYVFYPNEQFRTNRTFLGKVDKHGTISKKENEMRRTYLWQFTIGDLAFPFVKYHTPFENQKNIALDSFISVEFNEKMIHETIEIKLKDKFTDNFLTGKLIPQTEYVGSDSPFGIIVPLKAGVFYWDEDNDELYVALSKNKNSWIITGSDYGIKNYVFQPDIPLISNRTYKVIVSKKCSSVRTHEFYPEGIPLNGGEDYSWNFDAVTTDGTFLIDHNYEFILTHESLRIVVNSN